MEALVTKWGNSLGIRLPASIANQVKITDGTKVNLILKKNKIEIVPLKPEKYSLDDMLNNISDDNLHSEIETGESLGVEI
ncbi:AbrB/MazE/SpoVT family DNA-binding domain-containing protein [bacterium]|nr:AbrB/MazE/SpoVT family DNA-binding domain-containing protein [bacterium]